MAIAMGSDLMARRGDLPRQPGVFLRNLAKHKEGRPRFGLVEQLEQRQRIRHNTLADRQTVVQSRLRPVFYIHGQNMRSRSHCASLLMQIAKHQDNYGNKLSSPTKPASDLNKF